MRISLPRTAYLAVHGWGDVRAIPFDEVGEFCDADYLEEGLALCLTARRPVGHTADRMLRIRMLQWANNEAPVAPLALFLQRFFLHIATREGRYHMVTTWTHWFCNSGALFFAPPPACAMMPKRAGVGHRHGYYSPGVCSLSPHIIASEAGIRSN